MRGLLFALCLLFSQGAYAQAPMLPGFPRGAFDNSAAFGSVTTYQGPGDLIPGWSQWVSVGSCYSIGYSGNTADITDASTGNTTGTRLQCSNGVVSALVSGSACTFVTGNACSTLATTCAVSCNVEEAYDQTGNGFNFIQATNSLRPTVSTSGLNSLPVMLISATQSLVNAAFSAAGTPSSFSMIAYVSSSASGFPNLGAAYSTGIAGGQVYWGPAATWNLYNSSNVTVTVADNAWHSAQAVFNGASSVADVDGVETTGDTGNRSLSSATHVSIGVDGIGDVGGSRAAEFGIFPGAFTANQRSILCHNQFKRWATPAC